MNIDVKTAEIGVRRAVIIEKREGRRKIPAGLGFAQINYGRLFIRDYWTLFALARENDCKIEDFLPKDSAHSGPRWSELITASETILEVVRALPDSRRILLLQRGSGLSWRKIQQRHPERVMFSMKEDYREGLLLVAKTSADSLNFLASFDNFFVVKKVEAA